jgi:hypothetical protein
MENIQQEDIQEEVAPSTTEQVAETEKVEAEQDPLKQELEKVKKGGRTKLEKLTYTQKRIEEQLRQERIAQGLEPEPEIVNEDDEAPLTKGEFKKIQQEATIKTSLQLADDIENETERELVKFHINNTIRSTGNPKEDLRLARALANDVKNKQILETIQGKPQAKKASSTGGGAPPQEEQPEFTPEEMSFMKPPFSVSKAQIIAARTAKNVKGVVEFDK